MKLLKIFLMLVFLSSTAAYRSWAGHLDVDFTGISYHIGANSENPAYTEAPRRLDKNGAFVFSPGLGVGYDFRQKIDQNGFSFITKGVYFQDCDIRSFFTLGGGTRYRYMLSKKFSVDLNGMAMLAAGQDWNASQYNYSVLPLILLGSNYHLENDMTVGLNLTVSLPNTSFDATSQFWIIFMMLQFSFPIA